MNLGEKIKKLRTTKNITQADLAEKLYISDKTISSWENNRTQPSIEFILKLSEILECDVNDLINNNIEKYDIITELKFKINYQKYKYLNSYLDTYARKLIDSNHHDIYYESKHKLKEKEWLRISSRGNKNHLTYKKWVDDKTCKKYDVIVDNIKNTGKILSALGFKPLVICDKKRKSYELSGCLISIDNVKDLGYFIEIVTPKSDNYIETLNQITNIIKKLYLDIKDIEREKYPKLILNKNAK